MRSKVLCAFLLLCCCFKPYAQEAVQVKKALAARTGFNYGREAVYTDRLAYLMFNGELKKPADGQKLSGAESDTAVWRTIEADSTNRLRVRGSRRDFLRGGGTYFYFTYDADRERSALVNIQGNSAFILNGVPHAGDPYSSGWLKVPVKLKKGTNEFFVRGFAIDARIEFSSKVALLDTLDSTLPSIVPGEDHSKLLGGLVILNNSAKNLVDLEIETNIGGKIITTQLPTVPAYGTRKVPFYMDASAVDKPGDVKCVVQLKSKNKLIDTRNITLDAPVKGRPYKKTFISNIDGSVQYYAVTPQSGGHTPGSALFLSVHGAGVEAISQARAYKPKDWGTLVAPTNRRPRGFNWEDWGRMDALEVLGIAESQFKPAKNQIYLTGHSMGGHGTWFLGATYPDKWAAIAPCAGYPTLKEYGSADGLVPDSSTSPLVSRVLRSGNQSDVIQLVSNYKNLGVYIFHGDSDRVVPVDYARQMKKLLANFHGDISYYEYPGGSHWFGDHSVDWPPLFDYFKWHKRKEDSVSNLVDFVTFNPGISASYRWATIYQQQEPLNMSRLQLSRNLESKKITGKTENVQVLKVNLGEFGENTLLEITLDSSSPVKYEVKSKTDSIYLEKKNNAWSITTAPGKKMKGPHRNGTLKDAFNNRMIFVYGTKGTSQENAWNYQKAKYDAESWYYRGNGAVDIVPDHQYDAARYKDRGVILYGNKSNNGAWGALLADCPIQVERNKISAGITAFSGSEYAAYFVWPMKNSDVASVAVITGTGMKGMNAAYANQYFAGASGFPDYMIFTGDMPDTGAAAIKFAGFYTNEWRLPAL